MFVLSTSSHCNLSMREYIKHKKCCAVLVIHRAYPALIIIFFAATGEGGGDKVRRRDMNDMACDLIRQLR